MKKNHSGNGIPDDVDLVGLTKAGKVKAVAELLEKGRFREETLMAAMERHHARYSRGWLVTAHIPGLAAPGDEAAVRSLVKRAGDPLLDTIRGLLMEVLQLEMEVWDCRRET